MARVLSGQSSPSATNSSEKAIDAVNDVSGNFVRVFAPSSNTADMYIGNDGSDKVDNNSGFPLPPGEQCVVRLDDPVSGGRADLYFYGDSADLITYIVTG